MAVSDKAIESDLAGLKTAQHVSGVLSISANPSDHDTTLKSCLHTPVKEHLFLLGFAINGRVLSHTTHRFNSTGNTFLHHRNCLAFSLIPLFTMEK